jgi:hypothetical protein
MEHLCNTESEMMNTWTTLLLAVSLVLSRQTAAAQPAVNQIGLELLQGEFAVCALEKSANIPDWALTTTPVSITRSQAALSIIASDNIVPQGINCDRGWRTFAVGFTTPSTFGVVAAFARPLARKHISIHWISSSPTDYLMVKQTNLETAIRVLSAEGHPIRR